MGQIHAEVARGGDQRDAEREHRREQHADGRVLAHLPVPGDRPDAQRGRDARNQAAPEQRALRSTDQVRDRDARQDRVGQRVAKEGHAPQHHIRAEHCAHDADRDGCQQAADHKPVLQGRK